MKRIDGEDMRKRKIGFTICMLFLTVIALASTSYAIFKMNIVGKVNYSMSIGTLDFEIQGETNAIRLNNAYPMTDSVGATLNPYTFSLTNTGDLDSEYRIFLLEDEEQKNACVGCNFLKNDKLKFELKEDGTVVSGPTLLSKVNNLLTSGAIAPGVTKNFELRLWLTWDATIEEENKHYFAKIKVEAYQTDSGNSGESLGTLRSLLEENKGETCDILDDNTDVFLSGNCTRNYVWYSGKLWRAVLWSPRTNSVKLVTDDMMTIIPYHDDGNTTFENSYADRWLQQEFLPTLHDYQNYIQMNSIWNASVMSDSDFSPGDPSKRPSADISVTRGVGLLNLYEYYYISGFLNNTEENYLTIPNDTAWALMTPFNESSLYTVYASSVGSAPPDGNAYLLRPAINMHANIEIVSGDGSKNSPYRLAGDNKRPVGGMTLISERYSGEYVSFNQELYRIVGVEDGLTKIMAVDAPASLSAVAFHHEPLEVNFSGAGIKGRLEEYYQSFDAVTKNMVEPNTTWYLGGLDTRNEPYHMDYRSTICSSFTADVSTSTCPRTSHATTANVGLPRVGELFAAPTNQENIMDFWTITPVYYSKYDVFIAEYVIRAFGRLEYNPSYTDELSVRPSLYLKSNVRVAKTNIGDGSYLNPYTLELGE